MRKGKGSTHVQRPRIPIKSLFIDTSITLPSSELNNKVPNKANLAAICGRERLNVLDENGSKIGTFKLSVSSYEEHGETQIVVHSSSIIKYSTSENSSQISELGMSITSRITPKYETLEEYRREYSIHGTSKEERRLHLIKLGNKYHLTVSEKSSDNIDKSHTSSLQTSDLQNFLSEGANIILIKYLALKEQTGRLVTRTMLINGVICRSQLFIFQSRMMLDKLLTDAITVVRTVKGLNEKVQKIYSWMNSKGHFIRQEWPETGKLWRLEVEKNTQPGTLSVPLYLCWGDDLQMKSIYIARMENLRRLYRSYILDYPELKQILSDFLLQTSIDQPDNIYEYAIEFFTRVK